MLSLPKRSRQSAAAQKDANSKKIAIEQENSASSDSESELSDDEVKLTIITR